MPYCEDCNRFWNPPAMGPNGECPECQRVIADPPRAPWHFKVLMAGVVLYLGFRGYQGIVWVIHHL
ncbi:MAG TPA: hypothetical protein VFO65_13015 [Acidimicrobiales bacterium]|nr:hypothetical protein [Acidimicrobiales bacterium]